MVAKIIAALAIPISVVGVGWLILREVKSIIPDISSFTTDLSVDDVLRNPISTALADAIPNTTAYTPEELYTRAVENRIANEDANLADEERIQNVIRDESGFIVSYQQPWGSGFVDTDSDSQRISNYETIKMRVADQSAYRKIRNVRSPVAFIGTITGLW